jgi:hypothetical protein
MYTNFGQAARPKPIRSTANRCSSRQLETQRPLGRGGQVVANSVPDTQPQLFESLRAGQHPWPQSVSAIHFGSNPKECLPGDATASTATPAPSFAEACARRLGLAAGISTTTTRWRPRRGAAPTSCSWTGGANEDELHHQAWLSGKDDPGRLRPTGPEDFTACTWDLAVIGCERAPWVRHVLARAQGPDIDSYLADRLNSDV